MCFFLVIYMNINTKTGGTLKFLFIIFALSIVPLISQETVRKSLNVTVYNENLGVIKDTRTLDIKQGISEVRINDVSEQIDPTSVHIKINGIVLEQNYQYDLASLSKILAKYINKDISLISKEGKVFDGTLISGGTASVVLKRKDGGLIMLPNVGDYQIYVSALPEGLITIPTLVWKLNATKSGKQDVEISYQTGGLDWHAEYVAVLNDNETIMDFNSWVSITNNSGTSYPEAKLKLIAGDVNRVQEEIPRLMYKDSQMRDGAPESQFQEKSFFEYHLYDLQRPATLSNNETKQISLFESAGVKLTKKYLFSGASGYWASDNSQSKVSVVVEFENKKENNLGMPMPKGKVRLYKSDGSNVEFIGEDRIDHTPKDEKIKLKVGDAFDIVAKETKTDEKRISDKVYEYTFEIEIRNRKTEDVIVDIEKNLFSNWEIISSSMKFEKKNASTILFKLPVKKDSTATLNFKVRYSY